MELRGFYHPNATLTFDGFKNQECDNIMTYLNGLPVDLRKSRLHGRVSSVVTSSTTTIVQSVYSWEVISNEVMDQYYISEQSIYLRTIDLLVRINSEIYLLQIFHIKIVDTTNLVITK